MRWLVMTAIVGAMLFASCAAFAVDWVIPPTFDPQRDITWNLVPGAVLLEPYYQGPDDPILSHSDFIRYDNVSVFGGWIGINNLDGTGPASGSILFHIDNWERQWPEKLIWLQADGLADTGGTAGLQILDPSGAAVPWQSEYLQYDPVGQWFTQVLSAKIYPNPPYEEFLFTFNAPAGGAAGIRNLRIATACVPEPASATAAVAVLGMIGVLLRRRR